MIAYNRTYRNGGPNIYIDAANTIDVIGNVCYDPISSQKACIGLSIESAYNPKHYQTYNIRIINNLISGSGAGIWFWTESPTETWAVYSNIRIEYNTIVDNNRSKWGGVYFLNGSSRNYSGNNTIKNNIIMGNGGSGIGVDSGQGYINTLEKFTIANNLFQTGESSSSTGTGAVFTSVSPFIDRSGKNFKLTSGAAARGRGLAIPDVVTDIQGTRRPSSLTDAGAYEYGSTTANAFAAP
jgi:hypothetical protein